VTPLLTLLALLAFAANSVLCRLALAPREIDAASFTLVRLASGALMLLAIRAARRAPTPPSARRRNPWPAAALLFLYAAPFSFAYTSISAGTGALILFTSVQATMLVGALIGGERFRWLEGAGLAIALGGLIYLVSPGLSAPAPLGSALMAVAGIAWGLYSLRGRGSADPLGDTADNFIRAVPFAATVSLVSAFAAAIAAHLSVRGALLAASSGALASGLGYTIWFAALRGLTGIRASTVQLVVPVLAAAGGVVLLGESITPRLVVSAALILGGVGVAIAGRTQ
jgi:drug/metabolite transporter (DMT)-like permease